MEILPYDKSRDLELYVVGEIESITRSKPGIKIENRFLEQIRKNYEMMINNEEIAGFTAVDDEPAGFVVLSREYFMDIPYGFIRNMYVRKESRGKYVWKALEDHSENYFRDQGIQSITMDVYSSNEVAFKMAKYYGYTVERYFLRKDI